MQSYQTIASLETAYERRLESYYDGLVAQDENLASSLKSQTDDNWLEMAKTGAEQFVFDWIADPYADLAEIYAEYAKHHKADFSDIDFEFLGKQIARLMSKKMDSIATDQVENSL